jgi:plasmid maintenance system antidote protein VapI
MDIELIRNKIKARGLKQRWIASEIDVHPSTLNRFLTGRTIMSGEAMIKLFQLLEIDPGLIKIKAS